MPAVGTNLIYELTLSVVRGTVVSNNIMYWEKTGGGEVSNGSELLNTAFADDIVNTWSLLINDGWTMNRLNTRRLNNLTDFEDRAISQAGQVIGDRAPTFVAFQIQKIRTSKETRSGWINIAGVSEADTEAGGNDLVAGTVTLLNNLAVALGNEITTASHAYRQVLVGGKYDTTVDPKVLKDESLWLFQDISSVNGQDKVTSQTSRKVPNA